LCICVIKGQANGATVKEPLLVYSQGQEAKIGLAKGLLNLELKIKI
jgi:hypothetical protein